MGQVLLDTAASAAADNGIAGPGDLSSANTAALIKAVVAADPAIEEQLQAALGDDLDAVIDDITLGMDNIDLAGDPSTWDAVFFESAINELLVSSTTLDDAIGGSIDANAIAIQLETAVQTADSAGLLTGDLSGSLNALTDPLQACTGTITGLTGLLPSEPIRYVTGFLDFDGLALTRDLATLAKNGVECAEAGLALANVDTSSYAAVFEYVPYAFLAIEKYVQVTKGVATVKSEYHTLVERTEDLVSTRLSYCTHDLF